MKNKPLVSIVTPSYNQDKYLEKTIHSVLSQTYPMIEYIIIDGGSTDDSVNIIRSYENRISAWISEPDNGQSDAINKGFRLAKGSILAWINSDDLYYPNAVEEAVDFLLENSDIGMVYGDTDLIDESGRVIGQFNARQTDFHRLMCGYVNIPQPAAFWRVKLWEDVGPVDETLNYAMDYDLWVRFSKQTEFRYIPNKWAKFRVHPDSKGTSAVFSFWPEMRKVHKQEGGRIISVFMGRYILRKLFSPGWNWLKRLKNDL